MQETKALTTGSRTLRLKEPLELEKLKRGLDTCNLLVDLAAGRAEAKMITGYQGRMF